MIEEHEQFLPHILSLFEEADAEKRELITSALTLLEVLVVPYRVGNVELAERYEVLLTRSRGVRLIDLSRVIRRSLTSRGRTWSLAVSGFGTSAAGLLIGG